MMRSVSCTPSQSTSAQYPHLMRERWESEETQRRTDEASLELLQLRLDSGECLCEQLGVVGLRKDRGSRRHDGEGEKSMGTGWMRVGRV